VWKAQQLDSSSTDPIVRTLDWREDQDLLRCLRRCVAEQKRAAATYLETAYEPDPNAAAAVSAEALDELLLRGCDVNSASWDAGDANVISFHDPKHQRSVIDEHISGLREQISHMVIDRLRRAFNLGVGWRVEVGGHFLYPPGGYMGWHTNSGAPCWRIYITHAEEPSRSFFRYRDPRSTEIVTSYDGDFDVRMFLIAPKQPLWHAIYSETNRYSIGFRILKRRPVRAVVRRLRNVLPKATQTA
jgi:hypothetical protein